MSQKAPLYPPAYSHKPSTFESEKALPPAERYSVNGVGMAIHCVGWLLSLLGLVAFCREIFIHFKPYDTDRQLFLVAMFFAVFGFAGQVILSTAAVISRKFCCHASWTFARQLSYTVPFWLISVALIQFGLVTNSFELAVLVAPFAYLAGFALYYNFVQVENSITRPHHCEH